MRDEGGMAGGSTPGGGGFAGAVSAEWTKLWTVRAACVCLVAGALLMGVFTFYYGAIARINDHPVQPVGNAPVTAAVLVQFVVVVLAMTTVTSEYATTGVRATLLWVPVRHRVELAKAVVTAAVAFVAGVLFGVLGTAVAWASFEGRATFDAAGVLGQVLLLGCYLALVAALTVGVSFALRAPGAVLTVLFLLLYGVPTVLVGLGGDVLRAVNDHLPHGAATHAMLADDAPYPRLVGFLIVAGWAAAGHLIGREVLRRRDA
ncbi:ABC transporter permease [Streptomyces sp. IB2014 016-6]|uniref:ABC transporter permease n=1 Tax=Streptomyces sp. IB2014 016-6 TaxID=2517818 RepID=UPI0011CA17EB|nr:ABC transporter permease [Streptomyces sp. IB2014 016-6]TXL89220.1 ABC transporter permease [Streptomyces sp. IB2014 016-6]